MNKFDDMFSEYNNSLENTKQNYQQSTNKDLEVEGSKERDKELLNTFIKQYNDDDGENGSFFDFLSRKFKNQTSLLSFLKRVKKLVGNPELLNMIENMIASLEQSTEMAEIQPQNKEQPIQQEPLKDTAVAQMMASKYQNYSLFAANKTRDKNYFPTSPVTINTTRFDNCTRSELVKNFQADKFYSLSTTQKQELFQAVVNDYLTSNGVEPCNVSLSNLPIDEKSICFGQYNPNTGSIHINRNLLTNLDSADEANNQYLPYKILSTLIHEAQHRVQFANLENDNTSEKDKLVSNSLMHPQNCMTYSQYLTEPDELDARNAAQEYIRQQAKNQTGSNSLAQFYNVTKEDEIKNNKRDVPSKIKDLFPDIYNNQFLKEAQNFSRMKDEKKECFQIVRGNCYSPELAKKYEIKRPY